MTLVQVISHQTPKITAAEHTLQKVYQGCNQHSDPAAQWDAKVKFKFKVNDTATTLCPLCLVRHFVLLHIIISLFFSFRETVLDPQIILNKTDSRKPHQLVDTL